MFQQTSCHLQGTFSRELQELWTTVYVDVKSMFNNHTAYLDVKSSRSSGLKPPEDGNLFAETHVGVSDTFYTYQ
jgi:hypothetical protein